jgi:hypothetical protein
MKKISILFALFLLAGLTAFSQSDTTNAKKENNNKSLLGYFIVNDSKPERTPYASGYLIDNQTNVMPPAKSLEMVIQHRFGTMENGISDLWGIFGAANTRLGLNYSITDWLQVGVGTAKVNKLQDIGLKINLLQQSRDKKVPLTVTYYGNLAIDARDEKNFGINYSFNDRLTYFNEILVTRKFCDWFTMTVGGSFTHFNMVDSLMEHDKIALHFLGRFKVTEQSSVIFNYDLPLKLGSIAEWDHFTDPPKQNMGIGWEIATLTHAFQVFVGTSTFMVPQYNVMMNQNDWTKGDIFIGFNITRMWNF